MRRFIVLRILLILIMAILAGRLYQLQLIDSDIRRYGPNIGIIGTRYISVAPRRGEIFAADGVTRLAESVPIYSISVLQDSLPPKHSERRAQILSELAQSAEITGTLMISPALTLQHNPNLRVALQSITGPLEGLSTTDPIITVTVEPKHTLEAVRLSARYSDTLTWNNPIEAIIAKRQVSRYQPITVKEDIPYELALAIRENSINMTGVIVVEGYRRHYPISAQISSFSHLLGHIRHISECELLTENPASSWLNSLIDTVNHVTNCRLLPRKIDPNIIGRGVLPYQSNDRIGKEGLEASYETELRGSLGIERIGVDALERQVMPARTSQPVHNGSKVILSIDIEFQRQVETILQRWINEAEQRRKAFKDYRREYPPITSGVAVALDPRNGQVLAMVSLPAYDNNIWVNPARSDELQNIMSPQDPKAQEEMARLSPLFNRALQGQYPPGSTIKQFVGAIALQMGVIEPHTKLRDPGAIILDQHDGTPFVLPNAVRRDNGNITVSDALKLSSNVFFASVAGGNDEAVNLGARALSTQGLKIDRLIEGLEWFGLGRPTGIKLAAEASGLTPTPTWKSYTLREPWTTGDTYNTAIGQGYLSVTPLQLVTASAAIANNGTIHRPQLVRQIIDSNSASPQTIMPEEINKVPINPAFLQVIREGMRRSVTEGINIAARDDCSGLHIAGKTGTAEFGKVYFKSDGAPSRQSHAWFSGFAPYEDPQIAVVVLLEGTGDLNDGSSTLAVPAVTQIMQAYFKITPPAKPAKDCPALSQ